MLENLINVVSEKTLRKEANKKNGSALKEEQNSLIRKCKREYINDEIQ